ncbi:hypothetical protein ACFX2F_030091 [Malus domestica]
MPLDDHAHSARHVVLDYTNLCSTTAYGGLVNAHINPTGEEGLLCDVSVITGAKSLLSPTTAATPGANNEPQRMTIAPGEGEDLARRYPPYMDQIWETLTKISTFVQKLQKNQTSAQVERHSDFVDMEEPRELERDNASYQIPVIGFGSISTIKPESDPIMSPII